MLVLMNKMLEETGKESIWPLAQSWSVLSWWCEFWAVPWTIQKNTAQKILNTTKYTMPLKVFCHSGFKLFQWFIIDVGLRNFLWVHPDGYFWDMEQKLFD
jgi:hypothetical protein